MIESINKSVKNYVVNFILSVMVDPDIMLPLYQGHYNLSER